MLPPGWSGLAPIDITSGFFRFECPETIEDLKEYRTRLEGYRKESSENPTILPHNLTLTERQPGFECRTITPSSGKRVIPDLILHPAFRSDSFKLDALHLVLTSPLEVGKGKWSQVWRGTLASGMAPSTSPTSVVIKIYQESFFACRPDIDDIFGSPCDDWRPGAFTAALESWAFEKMRSLQGDIIPWSYGFYKVLLPNGELAFAHIMEPIDGIPASHPRASIQALELSNAGIWNLADVIGMALHRVHACGLIHGDLEAKNVLLMNVDVSKDQNRIGVVLVDFGLIVTLDDPEYRESRMSRDGAGISQVLRGMGTSRNEMISWYKARRSNPPAWRTMFSYLDEFE